MWICHSENRALRYRHYSVVTWALAHTKSLTTWLFTTWLVWSKNKRNITYRHYWVFAIGITDYSTLCLKIIAWLTTKKTLKPSYGWCNHLGLFYIYIYIQATVVTQLSYRRPLFRTILHTVVSRRIFRGVLYENNKRYESVVLEQGVPCLRVSLL